MSLISTGKSREWSIFKGNNRAAKPITADIVPYGCVDPNPLMVERQDPDNLTSFQMRERCALEIAAVFKCRLIICILGDFSSICFHLLIVFKLTFFETCHEHHQSQGVKYFGSKSGPVESRSGAAFCRC